MMACRKMNRSERELATVRAMIRLYCRAHHGGHGNCPNCQALGDYAAGRLEKCPFCRKLGVDRKPVCRDCTVHCYHPDQRERVRQVMRWAGPRMLLRHPVLALRHLAEALRPVPPLV